MTCSTLGMSRPREATSVAIRTPLGDDLNLGVRGNHARQPEYAPVKVLQSLLLLELRVQREDR